MTIVRQDIESLIMSLETERAEERTQAIDRLAALGEPVIERMLALLENPNTTATAARAAVDVLERITNPRAFDALVRTIQAGDPILAGKALKAVLRHDRDDIAVHLAGVLPVAHIMVQQSIIIAVQKLGDDRVVGTLLEELARHESPTLRCAILKALGSLGNDEVVPSITPYLKDEDRHVREWAVEALKQLGRE